MRPAVLLLLSLPLVACGRNPPPPAAPGEARGAFDAAYGVTRADTGGARAHRVIRQGYASGAIVQYEIQPDTGGMFMALERDLRRPQP
jgi:hypothetical protein